MQRIKHWESVQFSSVAQSCPTVCDPMDCSTPGLPVHHQLLELTQTHVHKMLQSRLMKEPLNLKIPWTDAMDALPSCKKIYHRTGERIIIS